MITNLYTQWVWFRDVNWNLVMWYIIHVDMHSTSRSSKEVLMSTCVIERTYLSVERTQPDCLAVPECPCDWYASCDLPNHSQRGHTCGYAVPGNSTCRVQQNIV